MENNDRIIKWIDSTLHELSELKENKGVDILHTNGGECSKNSPLLEGAQDISREYQNEKDMNKIFDAFKHKYYNSPNLTKTDHTIRLIFETCTCPLVNKGIRNSFLCNCTVGYTHKIFETLFNKKVVVELKQSILKGNRMCEQIIKLK